jgi:hypothetical protein
MILKFFNLFSELPFSKNGAIVLFLSIIIGMSKMSYSSDALDKYYLVQNSQMPNENIMVGPLHANSLEECALLCERHNEMLAGSYAKDGAISTGYSYEHCNGFVYDRERQLCTLKNKQMGNFDPQQGAEADERPARYVSGYKLKSMINEINTPFPNMTSGMQYWKANPSWSADNWGLTNHCAHVPSYCQETGLLSRCANLKYVSYDVRPGAVISSKNGTTGQTFRVKNMQECADMASASQSYPQFEAGANAWTFHPDYTIDQLTDETTNQRNNWPGTCSLGHVREPYYQTLTPTDNGAISGFALPSLSREIQRFLF